MGGTWQTAIAFLPIAATGRHLQVLWASLPIIGLMLLGAAIISAVKRWRERPVHVRLTASEQLAEFRSLYEEGELSEAEFARLQAVLGERIKKELDIPAAEASGAAPQSAAEPASTPPTGPAPSANGSPPSADTPEPHGPQDPPAR
jgi:hypothetical protein